MNENKLLERTEKKHDRKKSLTVRRHRWTKNRPVESLEIDIVWSFWVNWWNCCYYGEFSWGCPVWLVRCWSVAIDVVVVAAVVVVAHVAVVAVVKCRFFAIWNRPMWMIWPHLDRHCLIHRWSWSCQRLRNDYHDRIVFDVASDGDRCTHHPSHHRNHVFRLNRFHDQHDPKCSLDPRLFSAAGIWVIDSILRLFIPLSRRSEFPFLYLLIRWEIQWHGILV